ncbi:MAG: multiple sugar transport system permease protein [Chloroflexota bacterium]|nr:multiple sugar transport system permease protein [Chloroflexota bacterium]
MTQLDLATRQAQHQPRRLNAHILKRTTGQVVRVFAAYLVGLIFFLPFYWMVSTALKTPDQTFQSPPAWIPSPFAFRNFLDAVNYVPFGLYARNTLTIAIPSVLGTLISCSLTGYGFSRIKAPGRDLLFYICLATMMVPWAVTMVPVFIMFKALHWTGTYLPLIVPPFFGGAYFIFLFRQFFLTIPMELSDAATIDGCSQLGILWQIILPLAKPIIVTVGLFEFNRAWSDYLAPLIFLQRREQFTLALGLTYFLDRDRPMWNLAMAGATVAVLPVLILFLIAQRSFIEGITLTGLKG